MTTFNPTLTDKEREFMNGFLRVCGNSYEDHIDCWLDLEADNYSCASLDELQGIFPQYNKFQIGGFLGSLVNKQVLWFEDRKEERKFDRSYIDLYWITNKYIEYKVAEHNEKDN